MASQSGYMATTTPLIGGLDFVTPKTLASPGTLSACLNYEVADLLGYRRIYGYVPYDGKVDRSLTDTNLAVANVTSAALPQRGYFLFSRNPSKYPDAMPFGIAAKLDPGVGTKLVFVVTDYSEFVNLTTSIFSTEPIIGSSVDTIYTTSSTSTFESAYGFTDIEQSLQARYDGTYTSLPLVASIGNKFIADGGVSKYVPIIGLHHFKDTTYAIEDLNPVYYTASSRDFKPGDHLVVGSDVLYNIIVRKVVPSAGSAATDTGQGVIYTDYLGQAFFAGPPGSTITYVAPDSTETSVAEVDISTAVTAPVAGLYKANGYTKEEAWEPIDAGYIVSFKNGKLVDGKPPQTIGRSLEPTATTATAETVPVTFNTSTNASGTWSYPLAVAETLITTDGSYAEETSLTSSNSNANLSMTLSDLVDISAIPADAVILGVKVDLTACITGTDAGGTSTAYKLGLKSATKNGSVKSTEDIPIDGVFRDYTFGSSGDLWDSGLTRSDLDTLAFDVYTYFYYTGGVASVSRWRIDKALVTIYYQVTSQYYYFASSTTDEVRAVLVNYNVTSGDWADGDAAGTMLLAQVEPSTYPGDVPTRWGVLGGDEMHLVPQQFGISTDLFADIESDMTWNYLDPTKELLSNGSRYQFVTANFYGNEEWEAMYGVSGAGRAFVYDGFYLRRIYTGLPETVDKPRHVAVFNGALALGYPSGNVTLSVIGDPENFDGVLGAASIDVGDKVTGLLNMNGAMLAIGGERSNSGLTGTDATNYALQKLNPYEGMLEYTFLNMGSKPIYCSFSGISTLEQSDAYGDFLGSRLSSKVYPWLLPRLQSRLSPIGYVPTQSVNSDRKTQQLRPVVVSNKVVVATVHRSDNQYKLWFADGHVLTMTLQGPEQEPTFTIQKYGSPDTITDDSKGFIPRAECSVVDSNGKEVVLMSHCNHWKGDFSVVYPHPFEMYKGFSFRATESIYRRIPSYIGTNSSFLLERGDNLVWTKVRVHGNTFGYAPTNIYISKNYNLSVPESDDDVQSQELLPFVLPEQLPIGPYIDLYPATRLQNLNCEGLSYTIAFIYRDVPVTGDNKVSPPYTLQSLVMQYKTGKGDF